MKQKGSVFYENSSWYHRTKILLPDGSTKYGKKGGFDSDKEAERSFREFEETYREAYRKYQVGNSINGDINLKDYLLFWFDEVFSSRVESTTKMVSSYVLHSLLLPNLEYDVRLKYVNSDFLDSVLEKAAKSSPSAGNKGRELLFIALKDAVTSGYIKINPVIGTRPYKRQKPVVTVLGKEKIKVLLKAACEGGWYLEILLALFCGLRKGEIMGLKYEDYDKAEHTISISRQISTKYKISERSEFAIDQYELVEKEPKTENSYRTLRVPDVIAEEIEIRRKQRSVDKERYGDSYVDKGYISCQPNGRLHSLTALNNALTKICSRNSLPHITVHGLRHMYATILLEMGVPLVKISALLGHGSIHTTFEYYCEMMDENEKILAFMNNTFVPEMEEEG